MFKIFPTYTKGNIKCGSGLNILMVAVFFSGIYVDLLRDKNNDVLLLHCDIHFLFALTFFGGYLPYSPLPQLEDFHTMA